MQQYKTEAIVLRRTNYGEADRILTLLTPDHGMVGAIAKGVRKPKSKLAGGLELFAVCDVTLGQGRGQLSIITSARIRQFYGGILKAYERTELAYSMVKKMHTATHTVSEPEFYVTLRDGLGYAGDANLDWRLVEVWFGLRLQALLGHAINLATDTSGQKLRPDGTYHFDFAEHGFYEAPGGRLSGDHIKLLRLLSVKPPLVVAQVKGISGLLDDCLWLVRTLE